MSENFDFGKFRQDIKVAAGLTLQEAGAGPAAILTWDLADQALATSGVDLERVACRPGCGSCCILNVDLLPAEGEAILALAQERFSTEEIDDLRDKARIMAWQVRGLDNEDRILLRRPCLFLSEAQTCRIHAFRPLLCRALTSIDPEHCQQNVALATYGESRPILVNLFQQQIYNEAFFGLAAALNDLSLPSRSITLTEAIHQGLHTGPHSSLPQT